MLRTTENSIRITVIDAFAAFRRGLAMALTDAGFDVDEVETLAAWAPSIDSPIAVVAVRSEHDLRRLAAMSKSTPDLVAIVIQENNDTRSARAALCAGATASVRADCSLEELAEVIRLAASGRTALPSSVARDLARGRGLTPANCRVSPREAEWIRTLARGTTVSELARRAGYSEREMYRCLHEIYDRMGVASRAEALVQATRWGLVG